MMNAFKSIFSAAAVAVALSAVGAEAATVTPIANSTNGTGNQAHIFGAKFNATTPVGSSWDAGGVPAIFPPPGTVGNNYQTPFFRTPVATTQSFFAAGSALATGASPKTLTFNQVRDSFTILWGSIDTYNTISFLDEIGDVVASYTGTDIATLLGLGAPNSAGNYEEVALLTFDFGDDELFKSVKFESTQTAFEFGLSAVPLPAGGLLLLTAFGGLAALRRRRATV